jgi:hypothetical protein
LQSRDGRIEIKPTSRGGWGSGGRGRVCYNLVALSAGRNCSVKFGSVADLNRQRFYLPTSNFCGSYLLTNNVGIKKKGLRFKANDARLNPAQ